MGAGLVFLRKHRRFPFSYDFVPDVGDASGRGVLTDELDPGKTRGHRFQGLAYAANGDRWLTWTYPGLVGPPPVVRHGDGYQEVVAGSVEALLWDVLADEPDDEDETSAWRRLRAALEKELGPRPPQDDRVHPDFADLLRSPEEVLRLHPIPTFQLPAGPTVPERAEAAREAGDLDEAIAILERGDAPEWHARAMVLLLEAGRTEEALTRLPRVAERLLQDHDQTFDALPASVVDPLRLAADRLVRPWASGLATVREARASPQGRRDRLALLAKRYHKAPIGLLAIAVAEAASLADEGDLDAAETALAAVRAHPLAPEVAEDVTALERRLGRDRKAATRRGARPPPSTDETPPDLPLVEEIARSLRRSVNATAKALSAALAELAGPGATCAWDGARFRLDGTTATVDSLLDAAVERISH